VYPRSHSRIEKLQPFFSYVEHNRITQKQMLQAETSSNTTKVKQVSVTQYNVDSLNLLYYPFLQLCKYINTIQQVVTI